MCGIAGFCLKKTPESTTAILKNMADRIVYRGPDDEGYFSARTKNGSLSIGLAHRRLSIIDLGGGHQPMHNAKNTTHIVFNGEIYNYKILRRELETRGYRFSSSSDTETIIAAYDEWGKDCVTKLHGMFSFAIWDDFKEELFLARDRFGKKPLYYWSENGELIFGSEIKSLLTLPMVERRIDKNAIWDYLLYRYVPWPKTLFQGIRKLPPASYAIWRNGNLKINRYYTPPDKYPSDIRETVPDPVDGFMTVLDHAVESRMVADVPFGAFLSGGIDSSAVVGLMSRHSSEPIKTFSVGFTETQYSELAYAKVIADQFNTDHHELTISQNHLMDELPKLIRFRDAPVSEPSDIPIYLLSLEARKKVKMVLTGEGSDEFLGGYPKHKYDRYADYYNLLPQIVRKPIKGLIGQLPYRFWRHKTAINCLNLGDWSERMPSWFGSFTPQDRERLLAFKANGEVRSDSPPYDVLQENSYLRKILYFDQTSWLHDNLLERGDRMTMAASLEARMPFMDHQLAEYISSLPDECRINKNRSKWLLREGMKKLLPVEIIDRKKVGFRVPVSDWFRGPMKDYLCDHLLGSDSMSAGFFKRDALERYLNEHIQHKQNHEKLLWTILNLEIWQREYGLSE
ncbi:MAG: asparagine synthase (glutamine-hydrolyzing) [Candidatus Thiodiazotropha sp. (ex Monitilora ramsayi)]|nr:asparagine synthase (glutamine-hydrolyzing) [Candidatus Thiodiazotropha sp. (ex Monitilora ramsayi)]